MKKIYILIPALLFICFKINAQTTDVITGLDNPYALALNGNDLYIAEYHSGKVYKIDITATTPTVTDVISELASPTGLALNGNDLYIAESDAGKIFKIDITATTPTATDLITESQFIYALAINGNDLYYIEHYFTDQPYPCPDPTNKVSKINITDATPTAIDVVTGLTGSTALAINGNDLYIAEYSDDKISKIDITAAIPTAIDVITGVSGPRGLAINGNDLYIAESNAGKISKINIADIVPTAIDVVTGLNHPTALAINGNDLYIAEGGYADKISKFSSPTVSTEDVILDSKVQLYPNPTTDYIQISNLKTTEAYTIYNLLGAKIKASNISNNGKINIQNLTHGLYLLKFDNGSTFKFLKE